MDGSIGGNDSEAPGKKKVTFTAKLSWVFIPWAIGTSTSWCILYMGLLRTSPSSYEMLRGSNMIFTAINSRVFLKRSISWKKWASIILVVAGLIIVGLRDVLIPTDDNTPENGNGTETSSSFQTKQMYGDDMYSNCDDKDSGLSDPAIGDILVICSQLISSVQLVYAEKILRQYSIHPLEAVGWEGFYGLIIMSALLVPLSYIQVPCSWSNSPSPPWTIEDPIDGFVQLGNNGLLIFELSAYLVAVGLYSYGIFSVTKEFSATTKMVFDAIKAVTVWITSLCIGWETFNYLQLIGFIIIMAGVSSYNFFGNKM